MLFKLLIVNTRKESIAIGENKEERGMKLSYNFTTTGQRPLHISSRLYIFIFHILYFYRV